MCLPIWITINKMQNNNIKILNITGWGRSGSTILGSILGEIDGFFYAGEIRNIWNRVLIDNRLCGCGVPFKECSVWNSIFKKSFGSMDEAFAKEMRKLFKKHTRTRHIPIMFMPWAKKHFSTSLNIYLNNLQKLFNGIKDSTASKVIIDSSKSTVYGYLLSIMENIDLPTVEEQWVETSDGQKMLVWVVLPPHFNPEKKYPKQNWRREV